MKLFLSCVCVVQWRLYNLEGVLINQVVYEIGIEGSYYDKSLSEPQLYNCTMYLHRILPAIPYTVRELEEVQ